MLHHATADQEKNFMRTRIVGAGGLTETDIDTLDDIVAAKDSAAVCPRCGADLFFVQRDTSYAIWCANPECKTWNVMRGI